MGAVFDAAVEAAASVADLGAWVNNAGITRGTTLHAPDPDVIEEVLAINQNAVIWGSSAAIRRFMAQGSGGSVVTVSSIHGRAAYPQGMAYDVAKAGRRSADALHRRRIRTGRDTSQQRRPGCRHDPDEPHDDRRHPRPGRTGAGDRRFGANAAHRLGGGDRRRGGFPWSPTTLPTSAARRSESTAG